MSVSIVHEITDYANYYLARSRGRIWPVRGEPGFTDSDPKDIQIGDSIGTWSAANRTPDFRVEHAPNCGQYPLVCASYPRVNVGDRQISDCRQVSTGEYSWQLICVCGQTKTTRDPFGSNSCRNWQAHSRDIHLFMVGILRARDRETTWRLPTVDDLQYRAA